MKIDILTIFPEFFQGTDASLIGKAKEKNILDIKCHNIRDYTLNKHKKVDEYVFGGGPGMLMMPEPIDRCLKDINAKEKRIIYMSPKGTTLNKELAEELAKEKEIVILCGRYEGIDERIIENWDMEEISIGDYILTGGEPAAIVLIDVVARMVEEVIGNKDSIMEESIYSGLLETPQYTQPREYGGKQVPEVLLNGNHKAIHLWQFEKSLLLTKERRMDLLIEYIEKQNDNGTIDYEQIRIEKAKSLKSAYNALTSSSSFKRKFSKEEMKILEKICCEDENEQEKK